ncbi:MAG TPA: hypothetical protein VEI06_05860 [Gemmatimonadaceae bacterium]|nr:hypothetical protein [Gemmatimonadaceae bacterium]
MTSPSARIDALRAIVAKQPGNAVARFGLGVEALKAELWQEAADHLTTYLATADDEGNGYGRLAEALVRLGRADDARAALRKGVEAAERFGHPGMASEFESRIEELDAES